jgi:hypothetical protein
VRVKDPGGRRRPRRPPGSRVRVKDPGGRRRPRRRPADRVRVEDPEERRRPRRRPADRARVKDPGGRPWRGLAEDLPAARRRARGGVRARATTDASLPRIPAARPLEAAAVRRPMRESLVAAMRPRPVVGAPAGGDRAADRKTARASSGATRTEAVCHPPDARVDGSQMLPTGAREATGPKPPGLRNAWAGGVVPVRRPRGPRSRTT